MPDEWEQECPIPEDEAPAQRQAWRRGWEYRMEHGPGKPDREAMLNVMGEPSLVSVWLQGYSAADAHMRTS